jgi:putative tricarboxylic transport membrane protein
MEAFLGGMGILLDPFTFFMIVAGTVLGITVGALPGISGSTTIELMLPITIGLDPVVSLAFLGSIYCAANFGGSITAILVNAPGDPSASATALEGYKMAERGEAGMALGMSAVACPCAVRWGATARSRTSSRPRSGCCSLPWAST